MFPHSLGTLAATLAMLLLIPLADGAEPGAPAALAWPHWRGPTANGLADGDPPLTWSESHNVRWKTRIPGSGSATPLVIGDDVYVVTAVETSRVADMPPEPHPDAKTQPPQNEFEFCLYCLDFQSGTIRWKRVLCVDVPHEGRHPTNSYASASPVSDGRRLYVSFGSRGLYAVDLTGRSLWKQDLGDMRTRYGWGEGASPAVHDDRLIVNWDHEDDSFIVALDARTGQTLWKRERDEPTSWSTPLIIPFRQRVQVVVSATNRVRSYDLESGQLVWDCGGQTVNAIPSPLHAAGAVYCMSGYRGAALFAIPLSASGDITGSDQILWSLHEATPYVPSGIIVEQHLYFTRSNQGILTCVNIESGDIVFGPARLPGIQNMYASPVAADNRIYYVGRDGTTTVIEHGDSLTVLATNHIEEAVDASPVVVGNRLLLRGAEHLYCLEDMRGGHE